MADTVPLEKPTKSSFLFIEFRTGNPLVPTIHRYCDRSRDTVFEDVTFKSVPPIECKIGKKTGTLEEPTTTIEMPRDAFMDRLSNGQPHAPVKIRIREAIEEDGVLDVVHLFNGRLMRTIRNARGKANLVRIEARTFKQKDLDGLAGIPIHGKCWATFAERGCFIPGGITPLLQTGTMTEIDGLAVTITGLTAPRQRYFDQGWVELDGLRIGIRDYDSGDTFSLRRQPPSDWQGSIVTVAPGCDQRVETCRLWDNEDHFGGIGKKMQARNPMVDIE